MRFYLFSIDDKEFYHAFSAADRLSALQEAAECVGVVDFRLIFDMTLPTMRIAVLSGGGFVLYEWKVVSASE